MADIDRRIQFRESVYNNITKAADRRGVTPAAYVSMIVYDALREAGELDLTATPAKSVTTVKPAAVFDDAYRAAWLDEDD